MNKADEFRAMAEAKKRRLLAPIEQEKVDAVCRSLLDLAKTKAEAGLYCYEHMLTEFPSDSCDRPELTKRVCTMYELIRSKLMSDGFACKLRDTMYGSRFQYYLVISW